jgi:hypothetical protein
VSIIAMHAWLDQRYKMNQNIEDISIEELQLVNGNGSESNQMEALEIEYPQVVNNPPG